jgi:hypothetical protein
MESAPRVKPSRPLHAIKSGCLMDSLVEILFGSKQYLHMRICYYQEYLPSYEQVEKSLENLSLRIFRMETLPLMTGDLVCKHQIPLSSAGNSGQIIRPDQLSF